MVNKVFMLSVLILLVNYNLTEEMLHEWFAVFFALSVMLHLLGQKWWFGMKGKFSLRPIRIKSLFTTILIASLVLTITSGVLISQYAFSTFRVKESLNDMQTLHHIVGVSTFVLCCLHFGMHLGVAKRLCRKNPLLCACGLIFSGALSISGILNAEGIESVLWDVFPSLAVQGLLIECLITGLCIVAAVSFAGYGFFINQIRI